MAGTATESLSIVVQRKEVIQTWSVFAVRYLLKPFILMPKHFVIGLVAAMFNTLASLPNSVIFLVEFQVSNCQSLDPRCNAMVKYITINP